MQRSALTPSLYGCSTASPAELLERIDLAGHHNYTLKTIAYIDVHEVHGKYLLRIALTLRQPSFIRIETIPLFGPPDLLVSVDGNTIKMYYPHTKEFFIGKATQENLERLIPFYPSELWLDDIVSIFFGTYPVRCVEKGAHITPSEDGGYCRVDIKDTSERVFSLWIDEKKNVLSRMEIFSREKETLWTVHYSDHHSEGMVAIPGEIVMSGGKGGIQKIILRYNEIQLSSQSGVNDFDIPYVEGAKVVYLD